MNAVSIGQIERAIWDMKNYFGVDYEGMTNGECVKGLRELCPKLHSEEEIQGFAKSLLEQIESEFGFLGVRVWFRLNMYSPFFTHETLAGKYYKLSDEINNFIDDYRKQCGFILKLDVFLASVEIKKVYREKYGILNERGLDDLHCILRTIHLSRYNEVIIGELAYLLKLRLIMAGDKYYSEKDLTDSEVLNELYTHIAEEVCDDDVYGGHMLFHKYDGYGGVI